MSLLNRTRPDGIVKLFRCLCLSVKFNFKCSLSLAIGVVKELPGVDSLEIRWMHHGVRVNRAEGGIGHIWEPGHGALVFLSPAPCHPQPLAKILQNCLIPAPFQCVQLEVSKEPRGEVLLEAPHPPSLWDFPLGESGGCVEAPILGHTGNA